MKLLGVEKIILTNVSGAINKDYKVHILITYAIHCARYPAVRQTSSKQHIYNLNRLEILY